MHFISFYSQEDSLRFISLRCCWPAGIWGLKPHESVWKSSDQQHFWPVTQLRNQSSSLVEEKSGRHKKGWVVMKGEALWETLHRRRPRRWNSSVAAAAAVLAESDGIFYLFIFLHEKRWTKNDSEGFPWWKTCLALNLIGFGSQALVFSLLSIGSFGSVQYHLLWR